MKQELDARRIVREWLEPSGRGSPLHLDLLNTALIVCLGAYVIARQEADGDADTSSPASYRVWVEAAGHNPPVSVRDLIYDLLFPAIPKHLRDAVLALEQSAISPEEAARLIGVLFSRQPELPAVRAISECLILHYYPRVLSEPVDTPASVNRLCMAILDPRYGTFYDGTSGLGSTCLEAARYAELHHGSLEICAQEKMPVLCHVSAIRAYISGVELFTVRSGDVLLNPQYTDTDGDQLMQFDYSVMFPPLGASWEGSEAQFLWDPYERFQRLHVLPGANVEWLFILHQAASLREWSGRGIIAASTGALFNSAGEAVRGQILEENWIDCIITLPPGLFSYTSIPLSLVVIDRRRPRREPGAGILMVQAESLLRQRNASPVVRSMDEQEIRQLAQIAAERKETAFSRLVSVDEILRNEGILLPSRYLSPPSVMTEFGPIQVDLDRTRDWPRLGRAASRIFRGVSGTKVTPEGAGKRYRLINYADVQENQLQTGQLKEGYLSGKAEPYLVQPGDVLISCKGGQLKTCIVPEGVEDTLLSMNFIGVRLPQNLYLPQFLLEYLLSPVGRAYLRSRQVATTIITLKNSDIAEMPIPFLMPEQQQSCLSQYSAARQEIAEQLQQLYHSLRQEKWKLYQEMGLDCVLNRKEEVHEDQHW